jgi:peptidyl-prolyl cis-trans isomerase SurA
MKVLVTGAAGFVGKNLVENLRTLQDGRNKTRPNLQVDAIYEYDQNNTTEELERFWSEHREEYGWGIPHYRGMVIHCKDKKEAKAIKKYLRKYPMALWEEALRRRVEQTGVPCKFESGCYRIGENPFVDKLAFKCGSFVSLSDYPYTWILGEKLKKGPESMNDVKEKVEKGYRELMKSTEINRLRQKYSVEINEEVLKTVNNEGNN